jgi:hypothetical protein
MEDRTFDALTKKLSAPVSRSTAMKAVLASLVVGSVGLAGTGAASAAEGRGLGTKCHQDKQCRTGYCDPATGTCGCPSGTSLCNGTCTAMCPTGQTFGADCTCVCAAPVCGGTCCQAGYFCSGGTCTCVTPCNGTCCPLGQCCQVRGCTPPCSGSGCPGCGTVALITSGGTTTCAKPCSFANDCQSNLCISDESGAVYCANSHFGGTCSSDIDCPSGYFCAGTFPNPGLCFPATC